MGVAEISRMRYGRTILELESPSDPKENHFFLEHQSSYSYNYTYAWPNFWSGHDPTDPTGSGGHVYILEVVYKITSLLCTIVILDRKIHCTSYMYVHVCTYMYVCIYSYECIYM